MLLSQFVPPSPSLPAVSTSLFSMSASPLLPYKLFHQHYVYRFHIYVLIYDTCFSLSDLLVFHFLTYSLGSLCIKGQILYQFAMELKYFKQKNNFKTTHKCTWYIFNCEKIWMNGKNSWILLKSLFFFFLMEKVKFYNGPQRNSQTLGDRNW